MPNGPILEMRGITKRFPGLVALDHVDFSVLPGEIHALIGQNGAGKSTLMKILAGVYQPDGGTLHIAGQPVVFGHPREALQLGIGTVYQDLSLVPHLSVADNIFLGRETAGGLILDEPTLVGKTSVILDTLGIKAINPVRRAGDLPLTQQRLVEIAKVLSYEPHILILDEPTAALAEEETALLFRLLDGLRARGIAVIFISHRFKEVLQHCDRATVLRNGQVIKTLPLANVSEDALIELTIGERTEEFYSRRERTANTESPIALEVEGLSVGRAVQKIDFQVRQGEIVGITGLLGAGQNELARALFGLQPEVSGIIRREGQALLITSPRDAIRAGIGLLTEKRKSEGLILEMPVRDNVTLPSLARFMRSTFFIDNRREKQAAQAFVDRLRIKTPTLQTWIGTLSGGTQQKAILARWLLRDLDILIFIEPTQGIDVGAKAEIYQQLTELAGQGKSIIVVSEDLIEILGTCDRILIMYKGRLIRTIDRDQASEEMLLAAIQGGADNTNNVLKMAAKAANADSAADVSKSKIGRRDGKRAQ